MAYEYAFLVKYHGIEEDIISKFKPETSKRKFWISEEAKERSAKLFGKKKIYKVRNSPSSRKKKKALANSQRNSSNGK